MNASAEPVFAACVTRRSAPGKREVGPVTSISRGRVELRQSTANVLQGPILVAVVLLAIVIRLLFVPQPSTIILASALGGLAVLQHPSSCLCTACATSDRPWSSPRTTSPSPSGAQRARGRPLSRSSSAPPAACTASVWPPTASGAPSTPAMRQAARQCHRRGGVCGRVRPPQGPAGRPVVRMVVLLTAEAAMPLGAAAGHVHGAPRQPRSPNYQRQHAARRRPAQSGPGCPRAAGRTITPYRLRMATSGRVSGFWRASDESGSRNDLGGENHGDEPVDGGAERRPPPCAGDVVAALLPEVFETMAV